MIWKSCYHHIELWFMSHSDVLRFLTLSHIIFPWEKSYKEICIPFAIFTWIKVPTKESSSSSSATHFEFTWWYLLFHFFLPLLSFLSIERITWMNLNELMISVLGKSSHNFPTWMSESTYFRISYLPCNFLSCHKKMIMCARTWCVPH